MTGTGLPSIQSAMQTDISHGAHPATSADVGHVRQTGDSLCGMSDTEREDAIRRAGQLVIAFMREREAALIRWQISGDFADKGDADAAMENAQKASDLQTALIFMGGNA